MYLLAVIIWTSLVALVFTHVYRRRGSLKLGVASAPQPGKQRPFGTWIPEDFAYPTVSPRVPFDISSTPPLPYRPFRYGPNYPINLGILAMKWEDWIQLDSDYRSMLAVRKERSLQPLMVNKTNAGFREQAMEVLCEISAFLAERHPSEFRVSRCRFEAGDATTWGESVRGREAGAVRKVENLVTGDVFDFEALDKAGHWDPIRVAGLLTQDDLAVMVENSDGEYVLQAGSICTAGSWRLIDKLGTSLDSIHRSGGVVGWEDKLKFSMERFFRNLKVGKPVQRNNYFFQNSDNLGWNPSIGPEDAFDERLHGASPALLPTSSQPDWTPPKPASSAADIWFRTERQTLRRMPRTGCISFTIRTYLVRIEDVIEEPGAPHRLHSALKSWPAEVAAYKGAHLYLGALLPFLERAHQQQVEEGLVRLDEYGEAVGAAPYPF